MKMRTFKIGALVSFTWDMNSDNIGRIGIVIKKSLASEHVDVFCNGKLFNKNVGNLYIISEKEMNNG